MLKWRYAGIPAWREVSNHFREPLERSLLDLKTSLSPKDQRELFVPFSKSCCTSFYMNSRDQLAHAVIGYSQLQGTDLYGQGIYVQGYPGSKFSFHYYHDLVVILLAVIIASYHPVMPCFHIRVNSHCQQ